MCKMRLLVTVFILICIPFFYFNAASAGEYFIDASNGNDSNPGTFSSPWKSIAKANSTLKAGDIVNLRSGTYTDTISPRNSGSPNSPVVYKRYEGDTEWSVQLTTRAYGAYFDDSDYIKIEGLYFNGSGSRWIYLTNGSENNIINECQFYNSVSGGGLKLAEESKFNIISNCYFLQDSPERDGQSSPEDFIELRSGSNYNKIENCIFTGKVSHSPIDITDASWNVVRNCEISNKWHTGLIINGSNSETGTTLVENCNFHNNGKEYSTNPSSKTASDRDIDNPGIQIIGKNCIVRKNVFRDNMTGLYIGGYISGNQTRGANGSRIYNNTILRNKHHVNLYMNNAVEVNDVMIKNNIFFSPISKEIYNVTDHGNPINHFVSNSWTPNSKNFYFKNSSYKYKCLDKETINDCQYGYLKELYPDEWSSTNLSADPSFENAMKNDFNLKSNSSLINEGDWLTFIQSLSKKDATTFVVTDSKYFYDGWNIPGEVGDKIKTQSGELATIESIDYEKNLITVSPQIDINNGEGIALIYSGGKPDIGAVEYVENDGNSYIDEASLLPPVGVRISPNS